MFLNLICIKVLWLFPWYFPCFFNDAVSLLPFSNKHSQKSHFYTENKMHAGGLFCWILMWFPFTLMLYFLLLCHIRFQKRQFVRVGLTGICFKIYFFGRLSPTEALFYLGIIVWIIIYYYFSIYMSAEPKTKQKVFIVWFEWIHFLHFKYLE